MLNKFYRLEETKPRWSKVILLAAYGGLIFTMLFFAFITVLSINLPDLEKLEKPHYDLPTSVYDREGNLITEFYTKRRVLISLDQVPKHLIEALLAIEDSRFYYHFGIDPIRIAKAIIVDVASMSFVQGASTLTQQTAKMFLLSSEKKLIRKVKEALLAVKMERRFSKEEILELYLNKTYFGHGAYGIEAAAQGYFSRSARDLNLQEAALLAGLPQAPSRWAPTASIKNAQKRRNLVLFMMKSQEFLTQEQYEEALNSPIRLKLNRNQPSNETSYYTETIRRYVMDKYGMQKLYEGGLKVYTEMGLSEQIAAQQALKKGLEDHDRRQGFRGAISNLWEETNKTLKSDFYSPEEGRIDEKFKKLSPKIQERAMKLYDTKLKEVTSDNRFFIGGKVIGVVEKVGKKEAFVNLGRHTGTISLNGLEWARPVDYSLTLNWKSKLRDMREILKFGDMIEISINDYFPREKAFSLALYQKPAANGALFSVDPNTGEVRAMSGGYDFRDSEFNRATQSKRQPGSSFKPVLYSLAFLEGYTRVTPLDDTPLVFKDTDWRPGNYSKKYKGQMPLKNALIFSKNIPTIRLTQTLGPKQVIEHSRNLGIKADLPDDLTIGLGTASNTLKEMVRTYAIFANGGKLIEPRFIRKIVDKKGTILEDYPRYEKKQVITEDAAFLVTASLRDAVAFGTGTRAKALGRPAAGKTGTTNNYTDAWFIGYVPQMLTGVYMGFDDNNKTLGEYETGSRAALPVWLNYMQSALASRKVIPFKQPTSIQMVKVVPESGMLDCEDHPKGYFEYFAPGTAPSSCHQSEVAYDSTPDQNEGNQDGDSAEYYEEEL